MIQIHRLEGFYWVARTGGYARAARTFPYPISQPAVHQQVKKLEGELGTPLFERIAKDRVATTPAGAALYEFVAPFFEGLPAVVRAIETDDLGGELRIQADPLLLRQLVPPWLKRLQKRRPRLRIDLQETLDGEVGPLRRGEVDLLVTPMLEVPGEVEAQELARLRPFLVIPRDHELAKRRRVSPSDLEGDAFIAYSPSLPGYDLQMRGLAHWDVKPARILSAGSADTILGMIESGLGYSLLPSLDEQGPRSRGVVARPLTKPRVEFTAYAVWRRSPAENPFVRAALDCAPGTR